MLLETRSGAVEGAAERKRMNVGREVVESSGRGWTPCGGWGGSRREAWVRTVGEAADKGIEGGTIYHGSSTL